jgi:hypothetical protein
MESAKLKKKTGGSINSMEREVKNCTASDKGESDWQTLYTTTSLYVLLICPYFCN